MSVALDPTTEPGASLSARLFALCSGTALFFWTLHKLGKRSLLISICCLLMAIGAGFMAFAVAPGVFNSLAYAIGIRYPPLLYLILAVLSLSVVILHVAARLSLIDERCRRLAQETALREAADMALRARVDVHPGEITTIFDGAPGARRSAIEQDGQSRAF